MSASVIQHIIPIRFKQLFRAICQIGIARVIFVVAVLLLLTAFLYQQLSVPVYNYAIPGITLLLVCMIHRGRKDDRFLFKISNAPVWVCFVEYLVFSIPFIAMLLICRQYIQALLYVVLLFPICCTTPSFKSLKGTNTYNKWIKHIPARMFEWKSGFRTSMFAIILLYTLGLAGCYNIWFSAVAVAALCLIIGSFYGENEPLKILATAEQSTFNFLKNKILQHIKYWILFLLPLFLIALTRTVYWPYILAAFVATLNLTIFTILSKYAFYRPATSAGLSQFINAMAWLCTVMLPFSVFVFFVNIFLFFKAKHNLNNYLDAYY